MESFRDSESCVFPYYVATKGLFHGIQSFQIVISTADESTVYVCVLRFVSSFECPHHDPARKLICNALKIRYLCPPSVLHFPDVPEVPEIFTV